MRKWAIVMAAALLFAAPASAGPKDQSSNTLIAPQSADGNEFVDNATTKTKVKAKGCPLQVQMKGLQGFSDGDLIICIAEADVIAPPAIPTAGGNSVVLAGEVKKGAVKMKLDLAEIGCGSTKSVNFNSDLKCYLDDGVYLGAEAATNWVSSCLAAGMIALPNDSSDPAKLKLNPDQNIVVGLCQGLGGTEGSRINPPNSALFVQQGALTQ